MSASDTTKEKKRATAEQPTQSEKAAKEPVERVQSPLAQDAEQAAPSTSARQKLVPPIVGIGASAGGLEALESFFENMPEKSGLSFVVVQHIAPTSKSALAPLLRRFTQMPIEEAQNGLKPQPDCIYTNPPNKQIAVLSGTIQLMEPTGAHATWMPIDYFFRTLAQDLQKRAVAVILSGTGSDGTQGIRAINEAGGLVLVQDPTEAGYSGMPQNAISTGLVDYVLPVAKIPERLTKLTNHFYLRYKKAEPEAATDFLQKIFVLVRNQTGNDFSQYKLNTILRRIYRRMSVHYLEKVEDYYQLLRDNPTELHTLFRDLLIGVTGFFRDAEAFEILKERVLPEILKSKDHNVPVRVWVMGCSTGEEAYSVSMILREKVAELKAEVSAQVFATDIDSEAIEIARRAIYPESIVADVDGTRLKRFFVSEGNGYRVKKEIRDMVVFSVQNVIKDPPFSKLDLICCRNLLIYMGSELQTRIIPLLHYALEPYGFLFLGPSETIGELNHLFHSFDSKWKIYQRKQVVTGSLPTIEFPNPNPTPAGLEGKPDTTGKAKQPTRLTERTLREFVDRVLLSRFAPACAVVDKHGHIIFTRGRTGEFLELQEGTINLHLTTMAREGLKVDLTSGLQQAIEHHKEVSAKAVPVKTNGDYVTVNLAIFPLDGPDCLRDLVMVVFEKAQEQWGVNRGKNIESAKARSSKKKHGSKNESERKIDELQAELNGTKERLQTTIEELETSNEELKSTNEELQSSNEELQSSNEQLETSKEELQSANEELLTVNAEHQQKIQELTRLTDDMYNLLATTGSAAVFLDEELRTKRFTPETHKLIRLIDADIGRPITQIASTLDYDNLAEDARDALRTLKTHEKEVKTTAGEWILVRIMPYRTTDNVIEGVIITFNDITHKREVEEALEQAKVENQKLKERLKELEGK